MANDLIPTGDEVKSIETMAKHAVDSKYCEKLGGYGGVFSIAMYAREMNLPIMSCLFGGMTNVMGKITIAPQLMNAMIRKAGHKLEIDSSDIKCTIKGIRKDTGEASSATFSVEDARRAGIFKSGGGWDKYPSDMCFARALSRLARRLFPDVIGMAYVEGEIEDDKSKKDSEKAPAERAIDVQEATIEVGESSIQMLQKKYPQYSADLVYGYAEAMAGKKNVSVEVFAKECLKNSALFENYFSRWLEKVGPKKEEETKTETL